MKKPKRAVNKKLAGALIGYARSSYQNLAGRMEPPVSRPMISQIMLDATCNERLMNQVTEILRPAAAALMGELFNLVNGARSAPDLLDVLFPPVCVDPESIGLPVTEGNHNTLLEKKGERKDGNNRDCAG